MRVIAGSLGGRTFDSPHQHRTHPMSERMRGALFNSLGDIAGQTVLDAFAGSGALSYEAISRGAAQATAVDADKAAVATMQKNRISLGLGSRLQVTRASITSWLNTTQTDYDIVLADPPYNDIQLPLLEELTTRVRVNGLFVLSWPGGMSVPTFAGLEQLSHKQYGDSELVFYRRTR